MYSVYNKIYGSTILNVMQINTEYTLIIDINKYITDWTFVKVSKVNTTFRINSLGEWMGFKLLPVT